jgi:DNA repair protein RadC
MKNTQSTQQSIDFLHVAEVSLIYVTKVKPSDRLTVKCSRDAQKIFFDSWNQNTIEHKETFKMLLLNRANKVLGITTISEGGLSGTVTDVRLIYQYAIKGNASGIIIAHYVKKIFMQSDVCYLYKYQQLANIYHHITLHNNTRISSAS